MEVSSFWLAITALAASLCSVAVVLLLARQSPPAAVNRAAVQVRSATEDMDVRTTALERRFRDLEQHVDSTLEDIDVLAKKSSKRVSAARRSEQAAQSEQSTFDSLPAGHPDRLIELERRFRAS